ncbi:MAG: hypothetical protein ACI8UR_001096 [Natronomonas sp.]|jgi:hypothetical protein|uniref:hypothetical protein n=1 Tax=Natronomonas sp. TaxID=2184060 RepID=UPI003989DEB7
MNNCTSAYHSRTAERLAQYLRAEAHRAGGTLYVRGEHVADEIDLPPKRITTLLSQLSGSVPGLEITHSTSDSPTAWRISTA